MRVQYPYIGEPKVLVRESNVSSHKLPKIYRLSFKKVLYFYSFLSVHPTGLYILYNAFYSQKTNLTDSNV